MKYLNILPKRAVFTVIAVTGALVLSSLSYMSKDSRGFIPTAYADAPGGGNSGGSGGQDNGECCECGSGGGGNC